MASSVPFGKLVTSITQKQGATNQGAFGVYGYQQNLLNVELDVEKRLQADVLKDRIRIIEFFRDFDKLRKGVVGEAAFRTCIGTLNFRLTEEEIL